MNLTLKFNNKIHKWLSLVVGIQLLIWLGTGAYFNLMDHKLASGNEHRKHNQSSQGLSGIQLMPLKNLDLPVMEKVQLVWVLDKPYYAAHQKAEPHYYQQQDVILFDAQSGYEFKLDKKIAEAVAAASYKGVGDIGGAELLMPPIAELPKQENAVWRIKVADDNNTHIYVSNNTGRVLAHINEDRRLRDLMFKLHFMDYANKGGFNNTLIMVFAVLTLGLSVTASIWVIHLLKRRGYRVKLKRKRRLVSSKV